MLNPDDSGQTGEGEVIVFAARSGKPVPTVLDPGVARDLIDELSSQLPLLGFGAGADELQRLVIAGRAVAVIGLGTRATVDALRDAAGSAVRQLAGASSVTLALPIAEAAELQAVLTGAALGAYSYTAYRHSTLEAQKPPVASVTVFAPVTIVGSADAPDTDALIARALVEAEAVSTVKDLFNAPPLDLYPETLADAAVAAAEGLPIETTVWDEAALVRDGFGGIAGVGQGSVRPPRLVKLAYRPEGATAHLALVGKGITFDSGGLSLKPPTSMIGMKGDMTGAAIVAAAVVAIAKLGLDVAVTAWLCLAENMPSGSAIRPNDVLRIRGGKTVEVLNTDAEGRLVLADGLVAASEERPDQIIDVATLTGAKVVALGNRYSALMGDDALIAELREAAAEAGELVWPMPMPDELRGTISSTVADIANVNPGVAAGGMLLAAHFLREFVGTRAAAQEGGVGEADEPTSLIPWAHLDIAGCEEHKGSPYGFTSKGGTGVAVRTLIAHADRVAAKRPPKP